MVTTSPLSRAWIILIFLSLLSALAAELVETGVDTRITGSLVLALSLFKARLILSRYLGLCDAPAWRRGFNLTLTFFCLGLLGLYLAPSLS